MNGPNNQTGQLGQIVSWKCPSQVRLDVLRDGLRQSGLANDMVAELAPRNAMTRALREMSDSRVIRKLRLDNSLLVFQITHEDRGTKEITYNKEAEVAVNIDTGAVLATDAAIEQQARTLLAEHIGKRLTHDLTALVQRLFDQHQADLIPIRDAGGAYFVPDHHHALVTQVRTLLTAIGGSLRSFSVRLGDGDTSASVAESMAEYFNGLLEDFHKSIAELTSDSRHDVLVRRAAKIAELRQKLSCYRGLLQQFASTIDDSIAKSEQTLLQVITGN